MIAAGGYRGTGSPEELVQVYDARILLEAEAAEQAARKCGSSDLARLEGLLARDRDLTDPDVARQHTHKARDIRLSMLSQEMIATP